jgi:heptosyltransferase I
VTLTVPMDRIAIVMMSAVGDSVHVLPVITALKRARPQTHITWLLQPGPASLVRGHPDVDEIVPFHYGTGLAAYTALRQALADRRFDLALALQVSLKAGLALHFVHAPVKLGFDRARARDLNWLFTTHRIPPGPRRHVQDQYFEFLAHLGVPHAPVTWNLGPYADERAAQQTILQEIGAPYAAIVCGTSDADRDWMPERWAAVCDALHRDHGLRPVLVGGPSEREQATAAAISAAALVAKPFNALGRGGLRGLVGILDASQLVLSLDTAPMHIAVALGKPVIGLMSQADPKRTGPYGRGLDLVVNAFAEPRDPPDEVIWERRRGRMVRISVDDVLERVRRWKAGAR